MTLFEKKRIHIHIDPDRPPMTKAEVITLSQTIGGIKRSKNRRQILAKRYYTRCTDAQWLELSAKFAVLRADYQRQLKAFPLAFLISNDLLMPFNPESPKPTKAEEEQYNTAANLSAGIEKSRLDKQLEMKD